MWKTGAHGEGLSEWSNAKPGTGKDGADQRIDVGGITEGAGGACKEDGGKASCDVYESLEGFSKQVSELKCSKHLAQNCYSELPVE